MVLIFLIFIVGFKSSFAQLQKYQFRHLNLSEGLSDATVYDIVQDYTGFIWIGTRNGLNKYDANKVTVYEPIKNDTTSLSSNYISCLYVSSDSTLWVGTNYGLNIYDSGKDNFTRNLNQPDRPGSLSDPKINSIFEDKSGQIWIGTDHGLNLVLSKKPLQVQRFLTSPDNPNSLVSDKVLEITQDKNGNLWIGTNSGLSKLIYKGPSDYQFSSFYFPDSNNNPDIGLNLMSIIQDKSGLLWVGRRSNGIIFFNPETNKFIADEEVGYRLPKLINKDIHRIETDGKGLIWLGFNDGLYLYENKINQSKQFIFNPDNSKSINDNAIESIYFDRKGTLWVGTYFAGVNFSNPGFNNFIKLYPENLNERFVLIVGNSLLEDYQGNLWIGSEGQGLFMNDRLTNSYRNYLNIPNDNNSLSQNNVKCMLEDGQRGIWIGTLAGLNYLNYKTGKFSRFLPEDNQLKSISSNRIYDITRDKSGMLWIGFTPGGLLKFDPEKKKYDNFQVDDSNPMNLILGNVTNLLFDKGDTLWIGGFHGIGCKLPNSDEVVQFKINNFNPRTFCYVYSIFQDSKRRIWIGTSNAGLALLNRENQQFETVFSGETDKSFIVNGIEEDENGKLWLSTSNFVYQYDPKTKEVRHFDQHDGIFCRKFSNKATLKTRRGSIYMTGYEGVFGFDPLNIQVNTAPPQVVFTGLSLFGKEVKIGADDGLLEKHIDQTSQLAFSYDQNIFSIEFAALNYINPEKNSFAYKLEGFDKDWNYVTKPIATYMNLPSGSYTFWVKAANNDKIWNPELRKLTIRIFPAPWKSWWAIFLYSGIFAVTLILWARITKQKLQLEHKLQLKSAENRKQEELHQSKLSFFSNVAHEIRTPLTLILGPLEGILDLVRGNENLSGQLNTIKRNANQLLRLVNQLLDFQKHETSRIKLSVAETDLVAFLQEITDSFQDYARIRKIELKFESTLTEFKLWFDREELEKVFFNLLSNSFKFTSPEGKIYLKVISEKDAVLISVTDNGIGIPSNILEKVFDRYYTINNKNTETNSGFGIGLALSKSIVELHSGKIWVESNIANGSDENKTTFFVRIPEGNLHFEQNQIFTESERSSYNRHITDIADQEPAISLADNQNKTKADLILIIEDNIEIRLFLKQQLEKKYRIIEAANGLEGWEKAIAETPELIVSDILMPHMDGLELTSKLKSDERTSHIPIVLLTARNTSDQQLEGLETGAVDYITKPFSTKILLAKIANLLEMRNKLQQKYHRIFKVELSQLEPEHPDEKFLFKLVNIIEERISDQAFSVNDLAVEIGMSRSVLFRKVKALTGQAIVDLVITIRLKKAAMLLKQKNLSIAEVAFSVGFSDAKYFSRSFKEEYGKTPTEYMNS